MNHDHHAMMAAAAETTMAMLTMNHSGMDHGGMDHGSMDHGSMDHGGMGGMDHMLGDGMQMSFSTDWNGTTVLFLPWTISETWHLGIACFGLFVLAFLYEGLKVLREHLLITYNDNLRTEAQISAYSGSNGGALVEQRHKGSIGGRLLTWQHLLQTFLHMVQVTISYFLMLVFMTYQVWLCISVIIGAGVGYFAFGWRRAVVVDSNEHCH